MTKVFVFTTGLNAWNSQILNNLIENDTIELTGIYRSKAQGGDKGLKSKFNRLLSYGFFNLIQIGFQRIVYKQKNNSVHTCLQLLEEKKIPVLEGKKLGPYLDLATKPTNDLILLLYFNRIIPKRYLNREVKMINLHPGKLPKYRGAQPVFWAMLNEDKEIGISIHKVEAGIDTGDIYHEDSIKINSNSLDVNMTAVSSHIGPKLGTIINDIVKNNKKAVKQEESKAYFSRPNAKQVRSFLKKKKRYF